MSRRLTVLGVYLDRPDERRVPEGQRTGPRIVMRIVSDDLKARPVHDATPLTDLEALKLAEQLIAAVRNRGGNP